MRSRFDVRFQRAYNKLDKKSKDAVDKAIARFNENPAVFQGALQYKKLKSHKDLVQIRANGLRIIGLLKGAFEDGNVVWYSVGNHDEIRKFIRNWKRIKPGIIRRDVSE